jgi:hypothetical protein
MLNALVDENVLVGREAAVVIAAMAVMVVMVIIMIHNAQPDHLLREGVFVVVFLQNRDRLALLHKTCATARDATHACLFAACLFCFSACLLLHSVVCDNLFNMRL